MQRPIKKLISRLKVISIYGLSQSISPIGKLVFSFLIIRNQSIELWGSYVQVAIWIFLMWVFLSFGNKIYLIKKFSSDPTNIFQSWLTHLTSRSILLVPCFLILFFSPLFKEHLYLYVFWIILLLVTQSFNALVLYFKDFKFSLVVELLSSSVLILGTIVLINSMNLYTILILIVLANSLRAICYIIYYFKEISRLKVHFDFSILSKSLPFFIPIALGTLQFKIDTYFANSFFSISDLGKYEVFVSILGFGQILVGYTISPFLKNFFRLSSKIVNKIMLQFLILGFLYSLGFIFVSHIVLTKIYGLHFSLYNYLIASIFIFPLFIYSLLVNEMYKNNQQKIVSLFVFIIVLFQITFGFITRDNYGFNEALLLKAVGQLLISLILWYWLYRYNRNTILKKASIK